MSELFGQFVFCGDVLDILDEIDDEEFDAVFCDPPYGLSFMGRRWDHGVPSKEVWEEVKRVVKPGGHIMAFGGTRTYHRLAVAIEDAGWEIRDSCMWLYGSGFPKAHDISKALDKKAGNSRGRNKDTRNGPNTNHETKVTPRIVGGYSGSAPIDRGPVSNTAKRFDGYKTALKPAYEPIVLAMKPKQGTYADNALEHGVAGLNIDGGRIGEDGGTRAVNHARKEDGRLKRWDEGSKGARNEIEALDQGRFPANLLLGQTAADQLDEQTGDEKSRFFYTAKASKAEREEGLDSDGGRANKHPCVKPIDLCRYFTKLLLPPERTDGEPRKILVPFSGSGSEMIGAMLAGWDCVVGIEVNEEYCEIARKRLAHWRDEKDTGGGRFCPTHCDKCEGVIDEHVEEINRLLRGEQLELEGMTE